MSPTMATETPGPLKAESKIDGEPMECPLKRALQNLVVDQLNVLCAYQGEASDLDVRFIGIHSLSLAEACADLLAADVKQVATIKAELAGE